MKITDELYELGKNSKTLCTYLDDDYVLLNKTMCVDDSHLEEFINSLKSAKDNGINISSVVDYRLIEDKSNTFGDVKYTYGVFLEDRAKGNCIANSKTTIYLYKDKDYNIDESVKEYIKANESYLRELEERAKASQKVYDKLVSDCIELNNYNLTIDPKPFNFFFDKEKGYTIIDPISYKKNDGNSIINDDGFPVYISLIVFGYGRKSIKADGDYVYVLPKEMNERYSNCLTELNAKIVRALRKYNIKEEYINDGIKSNKYRLNIDDDNMTKEEIINYIKELMNTKKSVNEDDNKNLSW